MTRIWSIVSALWFPDHILRHPRKERLVVSTKGVSFWMAKLNNFNSRSQKNHGFYQLVFIFYLLPVDKDSWWLSNPPCEGVNCIGSIFPDQVSRMNMSQITCYGNKIVNPTCHESLNINLIIRYLLGEFAYLTNSPTSFISHTWGAFYCLPNITFRT